MQIQQLCEKLTPMSVVRDGRASAKEKTSIEEAGNGYASEADGSVAGNLVGLTPNNTGKEKKSGTSYDKQGQTSVRRKRRKSKEGRWWF